MLQLLSKDVEQGFNNHTSTQEEQFTQHVRGTDKGFGEVGGGG